MATLNFTIDEALDLLRANDLLPSGIRDLKPDHDGLRVTVTAGIEIVVRRESFVDGVLKLSFASDSWAYRLADTLGKVDAAIDQAVRDFPFIRREGKSLLIDLNRALQTKVKGMRVSDLRLRDGRVTIETG